MRKTALTFLFLLLVLPIVVYGCGGSSSKSTPAATPVQTEVATSTATPTPEPTTSTPEPAEVVAQIKIQSGTAEYCSNSAAEYSVAADNTGLAVGDKVRSGDNAQIAIEFLDGSSLVLLANSEVEIQNYEATLENNSVVSRTARVAVISGDVSGDIRDDLIYPPSVFEIVSAGEIYTVKGTLIQ